MLRYKARLWVSLETSFKQVKQLMKEIGAVDENIYTSNLIDFALVVKKKNKKKEAFTFIDLFAGIGGTRLGFERAGGECVFSSEWDPFAQKTYHANFNEIPHGDITQIKPRDIPDFNILVAGFPCQPFSSIGKRQGFKHATQGTLFYNVLKILEEKNNVGFLLENVPGLTTHDGGKTFKIILESLNTVGKYGYDVHYQILDAAHFGVPQQRKRIYIVGIRKDISKSKTFIFPVGNSVRADIKDYIEMNASAKYSISERLQKSYIYKLDDGRPKIVDDTTEGVVKTLVSSYHKIQRLTGTFVRDGSTGLRLFTENECKALMGFPKDFIFPVSRTQMYRQMGNSVVVPVIEAVAKNLVKIVRT